MIEELTDRLWKIENPPKYQVGEIAYFVFIGPHKNKPRLRVTKVEWIKEKNDIGHYFPLLVTKMYWKYSLWDEKNHTFHTVNE